MTALGFLLTTLAVLIGAVIYGSLGFGFAFVVIPVVSLIDPTILPPVIWILGMPFAYALFRRERGHTDMRLAGFLTLGKIVGTPLGVSLIALVGRGRLEVLFAVMLLVATAVTAFGLPLTGTPTFVLVGAASGVMGTAAALGGPPLSLALRSLDPRAFRATLALCFVVGDAMSLIALTFAGFVELRHLLMAAALLPAMVGGYLLSNRIIPHVDPKRLRAGVLAFAVVSSFVVIVEAVA